MKRLKRKALCFFGLHRRIIVLDQAEVDFTTGCLHVTRSHMACRHCDWRSDGRPSTW